MSHRHKLRVLFIVKKQRFGYSGGGPSSGLYNSAKFVCDMLREHLRVDSKLVVVTDNNDIDREVTKFRPNVVIVEALWVEPGKFDILIKLHPKVKWIVRNHSAIPFLAHEGMAIGWILRYMQIGHQVHVACNDLRVMRELQMLPKANGSANGNDVFYLPNYYPPEFYPRSHHGPAIARELNIGCFGAIRPLKNQLIQAVAAIEYATLVRRRLHFHINSSRVECEGSPILTNIRSLFWGSNEHMLIEHPWLEREAFIHLVRRMDLGLQCAYSETFNIVAADFVMNDVPIVVSPEINWVAPQFWADPNDSLEIAKKIDFAIRNAERHPHVKSSVHSLRIRDKKSISAWENVLLKCS